MSKAYLCTKTNYANTLGAAWYHSVHSDASSNYGVNKTLLLGELNNATPTLKEVRV